jgi:signal transduction histidine kinase/CheY-like chemotaxis protein
LSQRSSSWQYLRGVTAYPLRLRGPLAADITAQTLHGLNLFLLFWFVIGRFVTGAYPITIHGWAFFALAETGWLTALFLLRLGFLRRASLVYMATAWLYTTVVAVFHTGIDSPVLSLYVTIPISAAWLLGFRGALWTTALSLTSALAFAIFKIAGVHFPRYVAGGPLGIWAFLVFTVLIGGVPVARVLKTLQVALEQSRRARQELQEYRLHLEYLVTQRTAELVDARDQAESANRAKSTFLANMSHELRTPLSVILASSSLLSESDPTADQREDIDAIGRSGEHLLGLIDDVLDVAKIEAGKEDLAIAATDLLSTVRTVVAMMRGQAEEKHLVLVYHQAPEVPRYVRVDAPKLRQVLINLLGNAIKFTKEGTVRLRLSAQPADEPARARFCFDIEDSGVGVPQHDLGRIFEPFEQVRTSGPRMGTGLGLTITRRFVELMGGTLRVESEVGRGSRFVVELPLELATESEAYGAELGPGHPFILESGQPEWRVLIIDDDPESAAVLRKMLTRSGFQVTVAENGTLGIEAFQQWRPHFIWLDLELPQLSGAEVARRIRQSDGGAETKIAAITAAAVASERDEAMRAGFDDFTFKPFRQTEIFSCMARHLGARYSSSDEEGNKSPQVAGGSPGLTGQNPASPLHF